MDGTEESIWFVVDQDGVPYIFGGLAVRPGTLDLDAQHAPMKAVIACPRRQDAEQLAKMVSRHEHLVLGIKRCPQEVLQGGFGEWCMQEGIHHVLTGFDSDGDPEGIALDTGKGFAIRIRGDVSTRNN